MKVKTFALNTILAVELGVVLIAALLWKTFQPAACLPELDIPMLAALSLIALLLEHYLAPSARRCWPLLVLLGAVTFGLLPLAAGLVVPARAGLLAVGGGVTFGVLTWMFTFAVERMTSGRAGKLAPVMTALGLFLACQCFSGIFL